ncbi:MAG: Nif3-like dinuclear metal center hexameric protein [Sedimenticola sp.]|nr:MAG: Nif3-like dinuclear metal center hexameric protein [Sedimenticola sp.]
MTVRLDELVKYCEQLLDPERSEDYCPNGLQLDAGNMDVSRIVTGVTASQALIEAAVDQQADLLLVHHGFFWKGEPAPLTGIKGRRVRALIQGGVSLLAYHLPLDRHPELGNNRQLGERLGFERIQALDDKGLLWGGTPAAPLEPAELAGRISRVLGRKPLHLVAGPISLARIGWCTGGAQGYIEQAAALGCDAFISGEISEQTAHLARELGIHFYAAGHHATERYGVQALGEHLAHRFGLSHQFIDIPNPA